MVPMKQTNVKATLKIIFKPINLILTCLFKIVLTRYGDEAKNKTMLYYIIFYYLRFY
jgi:hypothetical protein